MLDLSAGIFTVSNDVSGRLSLNCINSRNVKIGRISVNLAGFEQVIAGSISRSTKRLFYHQSMDLQSTQMAPTEAIVPGPCDEDGMWAARQGATAFDFSLSLKPASTDTKLPSSFWNAKAGGIRYIVSATVQVKIGFNKPQLLVIHQEAHVIESIPLFLSPNIVPSVTLWAADTRSVGWLRSRVGDVSLKARLHVREFEDLVSSSGDGNASSEPVGVWIAGGVGHIFIEVSNESRRKVRTLKLELIRRLKTFSRANSDVSALIPVHFSKAIVAGKTFHATKPKANSGTTINKPAPQWAEVIEKKNSLFVNQEWSGVKGGESLSLMAEMDIPPHIRSIQHSLLVEASYAIQVSITPKNSPEISVEIPVTLLHPMSVLESTPAISRLSRYKTVTSAVGAAEVKAESTVVAEPEQWTVHDIEEEADILRLPTATENLFSRLDAVPKKQDTDKSSKRVSTIAKLTENTNNNSSTSNGKQPNLTSLDELDSLSALLIQQSMHTTTTTTPHPRRNPPAPPPPPTTTEFSSPAPTAASSNQGGSFRKSLPIFQQQQPQAKKNSTISSVTGSITSRRGTLISPPPPPPPPLAPGTTTIAAQQLDAVILASQSLGEKQPTAPVSLKEIPPNKETATQSPAQVSNNNDFNKYASNEDRDSVDDDREEEGSELARAIGAEILSRKLKDKAKRMQALEGSNKKDASKTENNNIETRESVITLSAEEGGVYQDIKQGISAQIEEMFSGLEAV
ncbi:hypothetical protein BDR26DRAFT_373122 [Obelidium mucronatum]|nr:hypothetical protein BDR26DRAFT_373122 [Obelidium mucronatum]